MKAHLFVFFLLIVSAFSVLRNLCLPPKLWRYSPVLSSILLSFDFMFTSMTHLGISFCMWYEVRVESLFFNYDYYYIWLFKNQLLKNIFFPFYITLAALLKINWPKSVGLFLDSLLLFQWSVHFPFANTAFVPAFLSDQSSIF